MLNVLTPPGDAPLRYRDDIFTNVTTTTNITYGSATNQLGQVQSLELDLYRPAGDAVTSRPAIVWIHGGGFSGGTKTSPDIVTQAQAFARKGYVNVSIEYRLVAGGCSAGGVSQACLQAIVDAQHDAQAAVRFLRANASTYGIDTDTHRLGRDIRRCHHRAARRVQLRRPRYERESRPVFGRAARPCPSPVLASSVRSLLPTRPACCSTAPTTPSCRTSGR